MVLLHTGSDIPAYLCYTSVIKQTCNFAVRPESSRGLAADYWLMFVIRGSDSLHTSPAGTVLAVEYRRTNECTRHVHKPVILCKRL